MITKYNVFCLKLCARNAANRKIYNGLDSISKNGPCVPKTKKNGFLRTFLDTVQHGFNMESLYPTKIIIRTHFL